MNEIQQACLDINEKLFEKNIVPQFWLRYVEDGYVQAVDLVLQGYQMNMEVKLWNSENEEREWLENIQDYENFESFFIRKVNDIYKLVNELKQIL